MHNFPIWSVWNILEVVSRLYVHQKKKRLYRQSKGSYPNRLCGSESTIPGSICTQNFKDLGQSFVPKESNQSFMICPLIDIMGRKKTCQKFEKFFRPENFKKKHWKSLNFFQRCVLGYLRMPIRCWNKIFSKTFMASWDTLITRRALWSVRSRHFTHLEHQVKLLNLWIHIHYGEVFFMRSCLTKKIRYGESFRLSPNPTFAQLSPPTLPGIHR